MYVRLYEKSANAWFKQIQSEDIKPNEEQLAYLYDVRNRCLIESAELKQIATSGQNAYDRTVQESFTGSSWFWEKRMLTMDTTFLRGSVGLDGWCTIPIFGTSTHNGFIDRRQNSTLLGQNSNQRRGHARKEW